MRLCPYFLNEGTTSRTITYLPKTVCKEIYELTVLIDKMYMRAFWFH